MCSLCSSVWAVIRAQWTGMEPVQHVGALGTAVERLGACNVRVTKKRKILQSAGLQHDTFTFSRDKSEESRHTARYRMPAAQGYTVRS